MTGGRVQFLNSWGVNDVPPQVQSCCVLIIILYWLYYTENRNWLCCDLSIPTWLFKLKYFWVEAAHSSFCNGIIWYFLLFFLTEETIIHWLCKSHTNIYIFLLFHTEPSSEAFNTCCLLTLIQQLWAFSSRASFSSAFFCLQVITKLSLKVLQLQIYAN